MYIKNKNIITISFLILKANLVFFSFSSKKWSSGQILSLCNCSVCEKTNSSVYKYMYLPIENLITTCADLYFWGRLKKLTSHQIQFSYLSKHGRLLSGVTEWIYLPAHPGARTGSKLLLKEGEAQGMLVYHGVVVGTGLVIHTPPSQHKLQTTWKPSFYGHNS